MREVAFARSRRACEILGEHQAKPVVCPNDSPKNQRMAGNGLGEIRTQVPNT
jgi:hypothetical protein